METQHLTISPVSGNKEFNFQDIEAAYEFCKSYEKNKASVGKDKYTNIFLVHIGNKLEFVKKYSLRGAWMRVVSWFKGKSDTTFNINENLERASRIYHDIFSKLPLDNLDELDKLALNLGIKPSERHPGHPGEDLKDSIADLKMYLQQLQTRVETSRGKVFTHADSQESFTAPLENVTDKFPLYSESVQSVYEAYKPQYKATHADSYKAVKTLSESLNQYLSDDEIDVVVDAIGSSGNEGTIVRELQSGNRAPLLTAIRQMLTRTLPKESMDIVRQALGKLAPLQGGGRRVIVQLLWQKTMRVSLEVPLVAVMIP